MAKEKKERVYYDENKTLYNKVQIEYLTKRIDNAVENVMERWDAAHPEPADMTDEEKYAQIVSGEAKLYDWAALCRRFNGVRTDLEDAYQFIDPREKEREECTKQRDAFETSLQKMRMKAEELIYLGDQASLLEFINSIEDMHP
jgi:hypothetical protein